MFTDVTLQDFWVLTSTKFKQPLVASVPLQHQRKCICRMWMLIHQGHTYHAQVHQRQGSRHCVCTHTLTTHVSKCTALHTTHTHANSQAHCSRHCPSCLSPLKCPHCWSATGTRPRPWLLPGAAAGTRGGCPPCQRPRHRG